MDTKGVLAITSGEPAGIGPNICLDLQDMALPCPVVILGNRDLFEQRARLLGRSFDIADFDSQQMLSFWHIPTVETVTAGELNINNSAYVLSLLDTAIAGIEQGIFAGVVTAPIHKGVINDAGIAFSGHTEYFAQKSHTEQVVMMLVGGGLRVALATTHLPLKDVPVLLTADLLESVIRILHHDLKTKFHLPQPRILITGLNPHAGELGHLGKEELDIIIPVIDKLILEGFDLKGPYPADTVFQPHILSLGDVVLTMYHDQGLPVLKYASFGKGVNITLGLPFIRTSVDHGTALEIASTTRANSASLYAAIKLAGKMIKDK